MGFHSAQAEQVVRVGIYDNNPLVEPTPSGGASGFFIDLLQAIAHEEGWQLQYVPMIFADGLDRLEKGELDLMTVVAYSEERAARKDHRYGQKRHLYDQVCFFDERLTGSFPFNGGGGLQSCLGCGQRRVG